MKQIPVNDLPRGDHELKLLSLGHFTPYNFDLPHRHSYFEFFIFENGGGSHFIDFAEHAILPCSVHIVFPQQIHLMKRTESATGSILICSKQYMNLLGKFFYPQLSGNTYTSPGLQFKEKEFASILQTLEELKQELQTDQLFAQNLVRNYTSIFLSQCIRQSTKLAEAKPLVKYSNPDWEAYRGFMELLELHFINKATVATYAEMMAMTPKVLNNHIRKVSGKTAVYLLQERTMTEAKRLLLHAQESIKEIAWKLNFKDSSYFTRFFTKMEGKTPKDFKTFWEEKYHS